MKLSQFKFKLPEEKIAMHPSKFRDECRLMVLHQGRVCLQRHEGLSCPPVRQ